MPKVSIESVTPFEGNAKRGDIPKIKKSLAKLGQYKPIVVNTGTHTGRPMEILAGNNTYAAAKELGWTEIEIHPVDVTQDEAVQINLLDNKLSELGDYDKDALAKQLKDLTDFEITGYDAADLDLLFRETAMHAEAFVAQMNQGMAQPAPQFSAQPPAATTPGAVSAPQGDPFATSSPAQAPVADSGPVTQEQPQQAPTAPQAAPQDNTVYFTLSYTVTEQQKEIIQNAIRRLQGENMDNRPTSPQALTEICQRFNA